MSLSELKTNAPKARKPRAVYYPERDGKPMAETPEHRVCLNYTIEAADILLSHFPDRWVSGNDFLYYEEGNPRKRVSPDCYIILGVPRRARRFYKVWEEGGRVPNIAFEFTSRETAREDQESKFDLYQNVLKVPEYVLFDPFGQYLRPRLQAYRLDDGVYRPIPFTAEGHIISEQTGLRMYADGTLLRFIDPRDDKPFLTRAEAEADRLTAQAELERLRALVESLQAGRGERDDG